MSLTFLFPRSSIAYALYTHTHKQRSGRKGVNREPEQQIIWYTSFRANHTFLRHSSLLINKIRD